MGRRGGRLMGELVSVGTMRTAGKSENVQAKCDVVGVSRKGLKGVLVRTRWTNCAVIEAINDIDMVSRLFASLGGSLGLALLV